MRVSNSFDLKQNQQNFIEGVLISCADAIIEKVSLPFAKIVLKITPPVPRRRGWEDDEESCVFHIRFQTEEGRNEVRL